MSLFALIGDQIINVEHVQHVDVSALEQLRVRVTTRDGRQHDVQGSQAIDLVMLTKPSALEGRRLRWIKNAWAVHNLVGHPIMQVLAMLGRSDLALRVHDATVPRPKAALRKSE